MKFRKIASLGATAALAVGGFVLSSPANAADGEWPADIEEACRLQGHSGVYNFFGEPYTWTTCRTRSRSVCRLGRLVVSTSRATATDSTPVPRPR